MGNFGYLSDKKDTIITCRLCGEAIDSEYEYCPHCQDTDLPRKEN